MPGLTWTPRFAWAFLGDALQSNNRNAQGIWVFVNRVMYIFSIEAGGAQFIQSL
jgi:hypothetical protein